MVRAVTCKKLEKLDHTVIEARTGVKVILCSGYAVENWSEYTQHGAYDAAHAVAVLHNPYTGDQLTQAFNDALALGER